MSGLSADSRWGALSPEKRELLKLLLEQESKEAQKIKPHPRDYSSGPAQCCTSWAQQRMWVINQMDGANTAYHLEFAWRLQGSLDPEALQGALDTIVRRHEILRTIFVDTDGYPSQVIAPEGHFSLSRLDLSGGPDEVRETQLHAQKMQEVREPLDLSTGPLIRGRLIRLRAHEHVLLITMHHIISDFWSGGVFLRELAELYASYHDRRGNPLPPLPIQYADYAQWQREWLQGERLDKQLQYWRTHLEGAAPELKLPTDRPRPPFQSYRGGNFELVLNATLTARLRALAQRHDVTLFMVLYAAWAILMSRLSGQQDVVTGTPIANRQRQELEPLIGFFVNTLALRVNVEEQLTIREFLQRVKEVTLGAYEHQDIPFERIVTALQPERTPSRNPIFQVIFGLQNAPRKDIQLPELTITREDTTYESAMFDLQVLVRERGEEIAGIVVYASDLFDRETVIHWMSCFKVLLTALANEDAARVGELALLSESERQRILYSFNATQTASVGATLIHRSFEEQAQRTPLAVAAIYGESQMTYAELDRKANQLARYLSTCGIGPDRLVGLCAERGLVMIVGILGILKAGGAYLPLDPAYPAERLQYMLEDASPQVVLVQKTLMGLMSQARSRVVGLDEELWELVPRDLPSRPSAEREQRPEDLVYVIYTSGSTGRPKGTAMTHRAMANLMGWHREGLGEVEGQRVLQFAASSFDVAFQEIFSTLCAGGTLVLLDEWTRRDARALTDLLIRRSIQRLFVPPLMLQSLADHCRTAGLVPESLRDVITAGEQLRISPEIIGLLSQLPRCRLHNHYGPTETHVVTALTLPEGQPERWPDLPTIGRPIANTAIYILDARRQPVPIGVVGEIFIGGIGVARGYLGRPEMTEQRFLPDPFVTEGQPRMYRTGDLARWRADGTIEYLGRNDDQVKIRGFRIELGEIETQLSKHDAIKDVVVVAREETPGEKRLVAYITQQTPQGPGIEELRTHLKARLPEHMIPSAFVTLERLPMTPSGKVDRRTLPAPPADAYVTQRYESPQGDTEEALAQLWRTLLRVERVGRHDNFFELGGHSLLAAKMIAKTSERFAVPLSLVMVFQYPTVQQLAAAVDSLGYLESMPVSASSEDLEEGAIL